MHVFARPRIARVGCHCRCQRPSPWQTKQEPRRHNTEDTKWIFIFLSLSVAMKSNSWLQIVFCLSRFDGRFQDKNLRRSASDFISWSIKLHGTLGLISFRIRTIELCVSFVLLFLYSCIWDYSKNYAKSVIYFTEIVSHCYQFQLETKALIYNNFQGFCLLCRNRTKLRLFPKSDRTFPINR